MAPFGHAVSEISGTDEGVGPDKEATCIDEGAESNIVPVLPGVARFDRETHIKGRMEIPQPHIAHVPITDNTR